MRLLLFRVTESGERGSRARSRCYSGRSIGLAVTVGVGVGVGSARIARSISRQCSNRCLFIIRSPPDDHFIAGPDCRVTARCGRVGVLVAVQLSVLGLYLPPVFKMLAAYPPQTIISLPVQTAVWSSRNGRIGRAGGCPTIGARIISPPVFK